MDSNSIPLLVELPELSDEAAAKLPELLYALAGAIENQYLAQIRRYYQSRDEYQLALWDDPVLHDQDRPIE